MIKTVKVKKQLRVDEFIKYIFDNGIQGTSFLASEVAPFVQCEARVNGSGNIKMSGYINKHTTFTVEVEEAITENTVFEDITVVCKINSRDETGHFYNSTLKDIKKAKNLLSAYIPIGGKLELIYERNEESINA